MRTNRRKKLLMKMRRNFRTLRAAAAIMAKPRRVEVLALVLGLFVAMLTLSPPAQAGHASGCQPHDGVVICIDPPEVFCGRPNVWDPITRTCNPPRPVHVQPPVYTEAKVCAVRVSWLPGAPHEPVVDVAASDCTADMRRALLQALVELEQ